MSYRRSFGFARLRLPAQTCMVADQALRAAAGQAGWGLGPPGWSLTQDTGDPVSGAAAGASGSPGDLEPRLPRVLAGRVSVGLAVEEGFHASSLGVLLPAGPACFSANAMKRVHRAPWRIRVQLHRIQ